MKESNEQTLNLKKKKSVVIYEVPGEIKKKNGGELDISASMSEDLALKSHSDLFREFLRTLKFEVEPRSIGLFGDKDHVMINGEEFEIMLDKTSLLANSAYKREYSERKDRCIEITTGGYKSPIVAKVRFNVEIDKEGLIKRIQNAINEKKEVKKAIQDRQDHQATMLESMRKHYFTMNDIAEFVDRITIHEGNMRFYITNIGAVSVNALTGKFIGFIPEEIKSMTMEDLAKWARRVERAVNITDEVCKAIDLVGPVGKEFGEYAKTAHHRRVTKDKVEEY